MKKPTPTRIADPLVKEMFQRFAVSVAQSGVPYAIGGAVAMAAYGYKRYTADLDVFAMEENRNEIMQALRKQGFAVEKVMAPFHYMAHLPGAEPGTRIDLLFPAADPDWSAVSFPEEAVIEGRTVNVFPIELLVASKFYSNQAKDENDITSLYEIGAFDPEDVRVIIANYDQETAVEFEKFIASIGKPRAPRVRPTRKGKTP